MPVIDWSVAAKTFPEQAKCSSVSSVYNEYEQ